MQQLMLGKGYSRTAIQPRRSSHRHAPRLPVARSSTVGLFTGLFLGPGLISDASAATAGQALAVSVDDFNYIDTSNEPTDQTAVHQKQLQGFMTALRDDVTADRRFELVPSSCAPNCPSDGPALRDRLRAASQAGTQILIIGIVHKVSTLVQLCGLLPSIQQPSASCSGSTSSSAVTMTRHGSGRSALYRRRSAIGWLKADRNNRPRASAMGHQRSSGGIQLGPLIPGQRTCSDYFSMSVSCLKLTSGRVVDHPRRRGELWFAMKPSVKAGQKANSKLACATNFPVDANETRVSVKADALPKRKTSALT